MRHTTPDIEKGICYGQFDIGLASIFETEVEEVLIDIPDEIKVYSSPLFRYVKISSNVVLDKL